MIQESIRQRHLKRHLAKRKIRQKGMRQHRVDTAQFNRNNVEAPSLMKLLAQGLRIGGRRWL